MSGPHGASPRARVHRRRRCTNGGADSTLGPVANKDGSGLTLVDFTSAASPSNSKIAPCDDSVNQREKPASLETARAMRHQMTGHESAVQIQRNRVRCLAKWAERAGTLRPNVP